MIGMEIEMIAEVETEAPSQAAAANQYQSEMAEETPPRRRVNLFVIGAVVLGLVAVGVVWYLYSLGYESTDDAQVDGHLNPIAARIDGTVKAVHVDDNQTVQAGMLLVELDPNDDQVSFEQAKAQYDEALAQL